VSINLKCVGKVYGSVQMSVDRAQVAAYADATSDALPRYRDGDVIAPPVFGIVPVWPLIQQVLADDELGVDPGKVVHGEQRMRFLRPIQPGQVLTSTGRIASITERGSNEVFVIVFETKDAAGESVIDQEVVCVSRGTASGGGGSREGAAARATDDGQLPPDLVRRVSLPRDITQRYARASGDDNRIHIDDEFARGMGLPGTIVHGMCMFSIALQGVIEAASGGRPEAVRSASAQFRRPVLPGTTLETRVYLKSSGASFDASGADGKVALSGTAEMHADY